MKHVQVVFLDKDGQSKGKMYTYQSNLDVRLGDIVIVDFDGKEKQAKIVSFVSDTQEGIKIKPIKRIAGEETCGETPTDIQAVSFSLLQKSAPVLEFNKEAFDQYLDELLKFYSNLVPNENNIKDYKAKQKELKKVRKIVDEKRLAVQREVSEPIERFHDNVMSSIGMIDKVIEQMNAPIKSHEERRRLVKKQKAESIVEEMIIEFGLTEDYANKITVDDKWCNVSISEKQVSLEIRAKAAALKTDQIKESALAEQRNTAIDQALKLENRRIKRTLSRKDAKIKNLIEAGADLSTILEEIRLQADIIYEAENMEVEPTNTTASLVSGPTSIQASKLMRSARVTSETHPRVGSSSERSTTSLCFGEYWITGTYEELKRVSAFLKENNIHYSVIRQGHLEGEDSHAI